MQALGLKPKAVRTDVRANLEKHEMDRLLKGDGEEQGNGADPDRGHGLGFGPG